MAQSGNGIDIGAVYQLLTEISGRLDSHESKLDGLASTVNEHTGKLNELVATLNEHSRRFDQTSAILNDHGRKLDDLEFGVTDLRAAVANYHNTVLGHGIRLTDLDDRVRRIERHLKLEPIGK